MEASWLSDSGWKRLARRIVSVGTVDIFGVVPRPLLEALRAELMSGNGPQHPGLTIRYYTPSPASVLAAEHGSGRKRLSHDWQLGHQGMRNIGRGSRAEQRHHVQSSLYGLPGLFRDCIIVVRDGLSPPSLHFTISLPGERHDQLQTLLTPVDPDMRAAIARLDALARDAEPLLLREIMCHPSDRRGGLLPHCGDVNGDFVVSHARPYGERDLAGPCLRPISVIVAIQESSQGNRILLKERTPLIDAGDFGDICLLGTRVQLSDVATALDLPVTDKADREQTWIQAGRPTPFVVPVKAFELAAQRELFITCGLEVDEDRLGFFGTYVVEAPSDEDEEQLGVAIFAVKLHRDDTVDEFDVAMGGVPDRALQDVPITELYGGSLNLNRFLTHASDWLNEEILAKLC